MVSPKATTKEITKKKWKKSLKKSKSFRLENIHLLKKKAIQEVQRNKKGHEIHRKRSKWQTLSPIISIITLNMNGINNSIRDC